VHSTARATTSRLRAARESGVFNAKGRAPGQHWRFLLDQPPQNCSFGGPDKHYLLRRRPGVVFRIRTIPEEYKAGAK